MLNRTHTWAGTRHFDVLAGTTLAAWRCPSCTAALSLTSVLKAPKQMRYRVRLECQECADVQLVASISSEAIYAALQRCVIACSSVSQAKHGA